MVGSKISDMKANITAKVGCNYLLYPPTDLDFLKDLDERVSLSSDLYTIKSQLS